MHAVGSIQCVVNLQPLGLEAYIQHLMDLRLIVYCENGLGHRLNTIP